ncbi:ATPase [Candidatus Tenderia electrophaga]|jgi:putative secretion ATPase (PEP-CTERM system associated)|uniref:ATPase n=1 Tax=Candidatus Tenderia electrophaga TaxID=1748243 RepID=A0A0S2TG38_9GAMM|nr:ATPase [Candidatus Tenderia electrophaga]
MYESFYRFSAKPFQLSPDPKFFFGSQGHKRAMSYLRYGLTQGEGFIVITGGVGTGKTTLVRTLFADLAEENIVAAQLVNTHLEADDTLRMVAASFGLAHEGASKAAILKNLETFLMARAREGKRVLLVVDEAQNLPPESLEELRMLSNFEAGGRSLLQSFLLGQSGFKDTIQIERLEQLRQRIIAAFHLEPLSPEETRDYIEHRMRLVGWQGDPEISVEAHQAIFEISGGVPRRINNFCDRLLLYGYLEELHALELKHVQEVANELKQETPATASEAAAHDPEPELPELPSAPIHVGISQSRESEQLEGVETRVGILEERIDILERALRRFLETSRR